MATKGTSVDKVSEPPSISLFTFTLPFSISNFETEEIEGIPRNSDSIPPTAEPL